MNSYALDMYEQYAKMSPEETARLTKMYRESDYVREHCPQQWAILQETHNIRESLKRDTERLEKKIDQLRTNRWPWR